MDVEELPLGELAPDDPGHGGAGAGPEEAEEDRRTVVVIVFAPKDPEPKRFRFPFGETVGEAAKYAAEKFGYEEGTPSFQTQHGTVLDRSLTLKAAGVHDDEKLELVDAGGGV